MNTYEIKISESGISKAYLNLIDRLGEHVTLLAKNGKPITSVMGIKRMLYRFKKELTTTSVSNPLNSVEHLHKRKIVDPDLELWINDVQDRFDVDLLGAVEVGIVGERDIKKALIKYYYDSMAKEGMKYKDIKKKLSGRYGVSVSSIEKLVYK